MFFIRKQVRHLQDWLSFGVLDETMLNRRRKYYPQEYIQEVNNLIKFVEQSQRFASNDIVAFAKAIPIKLLDLKILKSSGERTFKLDFFLHIFKLCTPKFNVFVKIQISNYSKHKCFLASFTFTKKTNSYSWPCL